MAITPEQDEILRKVREDGGSVREAARMAGTAASTAARRYPDRCFEQPAELTTADKVTEEASAAIIAALRKARLTLGEIGARGKMSDYEAAMWVAAQKQRGANIQQFGDRFSVEKTVPQNTDSILEIVSEPDNTFLIGASSDQHLCSKYERLDCLHDLYDQFEAEGVKDVFNAGNWIDGEANFNKYDLLVHGMDEQIAYLVKHYPKRGGMTTWAVSGDDHEGWYGQRFGIDIGRRAEHEMRDSGREDWRHIGFIEAHVKLVNANTGKYSYMSVMHPGGGSAYAISYQPQKIVESLEGGQKPAVMILGHYHKLSSNNIRNVWVCQSGACQDQTPFMKKKRIEAHVGGLILEFRQDPDTGAIVRFKPDMIRYFNRGYYGNKRWSYAGAVELPTRL